MACACDYCRQPATVDGAGYLSFPLHIRIQLDENTAVTALMLNAVPSIRISPRQVCRSYAEATNHAYKMHNLSAKRQPWLDESWQWTVHIPTVGSVPLAMIDMSRMLSSSMRRDVKLAPCVSSAAAVLTAEDTIQLAPNASATWTKVLLTRFRPKGIVGGAAAGGKRRREASTKRDAVRGDGKKDDGLLVIVDPEEDKPRLTTWNTLASPEDWTARNVGQFLLDFPTSAPLMVSITGYYKPIFGNARVTARFVHPRSRSIVTVESVSAVAIHNVPQYRELLRKAEQIFDDV